MVSIKKFWLSNFFKNIYKRDTQCDKLNAFNAILISGYIEKNKS